ncbi:MAG TPA: diaminopimelate epimerase [Polyangia bacterium]|jgi:diaminopimelate epimerase
MSANRSLPFAKVQGLGNDFVVVDLRAGRVRDDVAAAIQAPAAVRAVCDRHFGVGADGILAILPGTGGDARMRVLNADGSEAEMCGNGIRCVAKVLYEADASLRRSPLRIDTGAGLLECEISTAGGEVDSVAVQMGRPRFERGEIPMSPGGTARAVRTPIDVEGRRFHFTAVSMGNPHAVIFIDDPQADLRALAEQYGPHLEHAPVFPNRTNVEFARLRGDEIDLVVWERGCAITLACGTGACATVAAAVVEERLQPGREITVNLPGGALFITVAPGLSGVRMRGPATTVFSAELDLARVTALAADAG